MKLFTSICFLFLLALNNGFLITPSKRFNNNRTGRIDLFLAGTTNEYSEEEIQEMRELVLSISLEATDEDRRERLKDVLNEAFARPNGAPKKFTDLFDMVLVKVGDELQQEAKKRYLENQQEEEEEEEEEETTMVGIEEVSDDTVDEGSDNEALPAAPKTLQFKSPEEFQIWALVDMMVQAKTMVKKENGELGSKGSFQ